MTAEIKEFIEKNIDLIEHGNFEELYQALNDRHEVPNLTETLLGADINPARYMKEIPKRYLQDSTIQSYVIPDGINAIGDRAFENCSELTDITIPNSVSTIGYHAFAYCKRLTNVTIGNNVTVINVSAFSNCSGLTNITIPDSVTSIGDSAFYKCSGLTSVTIGNSVTSIGYSTFYKCNALTGITIPNSVISIGGYAFNHTKNLESINYLGTKDQWNKIKLEPLWNADSRIERIECADGVIELK